VLHVNPRKVEATVREQFADPGVAKGNAAADANAAGLDLGEELVEAVHAGRYHRRIVREYP
jgi:hypothetical protein